MSAPEIRTEAGQAMLDRGSNNWSGDGWIERFATNIATIEEQASADERKLLSSYLVHTRDQHGYPCPEDISRREYADGVRCICGLEQPKRFRDQAWEARYGRHR